MKYRIYWNSHKRCYSVQTKTAKGWRVWKHADAVMLDNVELLVNCTGQKRCRREGRKNVHAYLQAEFTTFRGEVGFGYLPEEPGERVTYDPFVDYGFIAGDELVSYANVVWCRTGDGKPIVTAYGAHYCVGDDGHLAAA